MVLGIDLLALLEAILQGRPDVLHSILMSDPNMLIDSVLILLAIVEIVVSTRLHEAVVLVRQLNFDGVHSIRQVFLDLLFMEVCLLVVASSRRLGALDPW